MSKSQKIYNILIIDKSSPECDQLCRMLNENNYKTHIFFNTDKAFQFCLAQRPDIILLNCDDDTPGTETFLSQIDHNYMTRDIPVIISSEQENYKKRIEMMQTGIADYILKPYYPEEVVARIELILQEVSPVFFDIKNDSQGFSGNLQEMNLIDLIQTLEIGNKSGIIHLNRGDREGKVYVHEGKIVDAAVEDVDSIELSYLQMLTWIDGFFYVSLQPIDSGSKIPEKSKRLFEQSAQVVELWRKMTGELPELNTRLVATQIDSDRQLTRDELAFMAIFSTGRTILQALEQSNRDNNYGVRIIKSLFDQGLLVEQHTEEKTSEKNSITSQWMMQKNTTKNRYWQIFSFFKRKKDQVKQAAPSNSAPARSKIPNAISLSKADLLLIRQKFNQHYY